MNQFRPVAKAIEKTQIDNDEGTYSDVTVSAGVVQGKPTYLEDVDEANIFEDADILLTDYTDPDWVPIMLRALVIITAEGGFLSHTAIISRELGIPCVTGLGYEIINELSKAEVIEVNGNSGKVKALRAYKISKNL